MRPCSKGGQKYLKDRERPAWAKAPARAPAPSKFGTTQNMEKVVVRVRPLNEKEKGLNNRNIIDVVDDRTLVFHTKAGIRPFFYQGVKQPNNGSYDANKESTFVFDHVCDTNVTNKEVFETTIKDMVSALMEGYNCSIIVYGATGAGKTFTMTGNTKTFGIAYLTIEDLFQTINSFENERDFDIGVSYIEVYNENVYDLLKPSNRALKLREDTKDGVMVVGLSLISLKTAQELLNLLEKGNKNRTKRPTYANTESSRSHAIFQVQVKMIYKTSGQHRLVKLSMIDLAGSEGASATSCDGDKFKEGSNINKSLLALGNVINKLAKGSIHVPYRDSKLTRLLKDNLSGNCKTIMIANVSPSSISYENTLNSLNYATRAKKIKHTIKKINVMYENIGISHGINEKLTREVKVLRTKLSLLILKRAVREANPVKGGKAEQEWRERLSHDEEDLGVQEGRLFTLMHAQRELAARAARAQICTEDLQRQTRAAKNYTKQSAQLDSKVLTAWTKWNACKMKLKLTCEQALSHCPKLNDFVEKIQLQSELRHFKAKEVLSRKLLTIEDEEIARFTEEYMRNVTKVLEKLNFDVRGYYEAPALTAEYLEIKEKAEIAKDVFWSDNNAESDAHFNLDKPSTSAGYDFTTKDTVNETTDNTLHSDDSSDIEISKPVKVSAKKRKPLIELVDDDTVIIINDSKSLDATSSINLPKKIKRKFVIAPEVDNFDGIGPDLYASRALAGKTKAVTEAESAKDVFWSDNNAESDAHFNLDKPSTSAGYGFTTKDTVNETTDNTLHSDDSSDIEISKPVKVSAKKRKPLIELVDDDTVISINDSKSLDATSSINLPKKIKRKFVIAPEVENFDGIGPDLYASRALAEKKKEVTEAASKTDKMENVPQPVRRGLVDRTNASNGGDQNIDNIGGGTMKPAAHEALPFRQLPAPAPAFGSSVARDGTPFVANREFVQVRARRRGKYYPYWRAPPLADKSEKR